IVSGPAGWLVAVALLASVALLAVDVALAIVGEGSWFDVAMSALGVLTLGAGPALLRAGRLVRSGSLFKLGSSRGLSSALSTLASRFSNVGLFKGAFNAVRPSTYLNALRNGITTFKNIRGFPQALSMLDDVARLKANFGDDLFRVYGAVAR